MAIPSKRVRNIAEYISSARAGRTAKQTARKAEAAAEAAGRSRQQAGKNRYSHLPYPPDPIALPPSHSSKPGDAARANRYEAGRRSRSSPEATRRREQKRREVEEAYKKGRPARTNENILPVLYNSKTPRTWKRKALVGGVAGVAGVTAFSGVNSSAASARKSGLPPGHQTGIYGM